MSESHGNRYALCVPNGPDLVPVFTASILPVSLIKPSSSLRKGLVYIGPRKRGQHEHGASGNCDVSSISFRLKYDTPEERTIRFTLDDNFGTRVKRFPRYRFAFSSTRHGDESSLPSRVTILGQLRTARDYILSRKTFQPILANGKYLFPGTILSGKRGKVSSKNSVPSDTRSMGVCFSRTRVRTS